jgi:[ribosomal protein S18]-alanine N-acetyltransferase
MIKRGSGAHLNRVVNFSGGQYELKAATSDDIDAMLDIETICFSAPWPRVAFAEEITHRSWSRVIGAFSGNELIGFMIYWLVASELHLLNLAVHPNWRRQGVGLKLIKYLLADALKEQRQAILLEVRTSNLAAIKLYRRFGFEELTVRPGYYADNGEDALVMLLELDSDQLP